MTDMAFWTLIIYAAGMTLALAATLIRLETERYNHRWAKWLLDTIEEDRLCDYCDTAPMTPTPNGVLSCGGTYCKNAYKNYLEETNNEA